MNIDTLVLLAYDELAEIDEEIEGQRFQQAVDRSNNLLSLLSSNKSEAATHVNYPLIKPELDRIEGEVRANRRIAKVRENLAYGAQLIRTNPFVAIIHLGHDLLTSGLPQLDNQRKRMQNEAYEAWMSEEWANHRSPAKQPDGAYNTATS